MAETTRSRIRCAVVIIALALPLMLHGILHAAPLDFSRPWTAVQSKVLMRAAPDAAGGELRLPFARVTTSFFADFILVQAPELRPFDIGQLDQLTRIPINGVASGLAVADFNGDGTDDFAVADFAGDRVDVYLTRGDREFELANSIGVGPCPVMISASDVDRDGHADLSTLSFYDQTISSARGSGDGRFARPTTSKTGLAALPVLAEDGLAIIDFSTLKNTTQSTRMSDATRQRLLKYLSNAEKAYGRRNKRRTVSQLQKFIKYLKEVDDSRLRATGRDTLILMAKQLIEQILAWRVSVDLTASPGTVAQGDSSTLSWTSFNAATATIDQGVGSVPVNGSASVAPMVTTTYTIAATDVDGLSALDSEVVVVTDGPNTIYVDAENGDDTTGTGTMANPYRSITKGLSAAASGYTVSAAEGLYDVANGEQFPLVLPSGVRLLGAGPAKTAVVGVGTAPPFPCTVQMNPDSVLDSVGLHGAGIIAMAGIAPGTTMGHLEVRNSRIIGYLFGLFLAPLGPGTPSVDVSNCVFDGALFGAQLASANATVENSKFNSSTSAGLLVADTNLDVSGSAFQGNAIGMQTIGPLTAGPFRGNSITGNLTTGVICGSGARPDFGASAGNPGNNIIQNLGAGAAYNFWNSDAATVVDAIGNTWDHNPPWTDYTGTYPPGVDIAGNGPNVKWQ
ncbi:MAG: DUF1565 domain-containing protein [Acidobacteriota bacterium]